jgi:hypothetical protein
MREILDALIPERFTSPAARRAWAAALLLFPAALAAGFFLLLKDAPPLPVPVTVDHDKAISLARAFLVREGLPAGAWNASCTASTSSELLGFTNARPERIKLWSIAPPFSASCGFTAPGNAQPVHVAISVDGRILGFDRKNLPVPGSELSDKDALSLATARLPAGIHFSAPSVDKSGGGRTYTFHSTAIADADLKTVVVIQGGRVAAFETTVEPDDAAASNRSETAQTLLTVCGALFAGLVVIFSIYRYASRALQQEVSHQRGLIVALLCGSFCILCGFNAVVQSESATAPFAIILLIFAIMGLVGGALVAAAYGSGEGDVREAFPGKLTSLDTVLTGRIFSRNFGVSVLFGMACAGWLIFAMGAVNGLFRSHEPRGTQAMLAPFVRLWWLMPLVTLPLMSLCYAAAGLLQPLAFLNRYAARARRWHLPVLIVSAGLISTLRIHAPTLLEFLVSTAIFVLALLLPFFLRDLLAALVSAGVMFAAVEMSGNLAAVPSFCLPYGIVHTLLGCGAAVFAIVCVARGRTWREEEVRPLYARHIAQRKALEAEVSAAREAQLRLLPDRAPDFSGLDISAVCVPAETVGGDFYDFFPLGDGRLGVFIAEGNRRGLAAALTIALAKGYLMQCVERFHEPVEILSRLETALASMFDRDSLATDFAFAAIDTVAGEVHYARTSSYPKVVVVSAPSPPAAERMVPVKGRGSPIAEGRAQLGPGDHVVLFTDGMGRRLAASNRKPEEVAASLVAGASLGTADEVREEFFTSTKALLEPDDLTVVVIRLRALAEAEGTAALGVVA